MKINEKTLINFSTSNVPADREGWLFKRGEVNKAFQRRWFVLRGNLLFYFERQTDKDPVGVIILEGCTVELAEDEVDVFAFKIVFHGDGRPGRTYVLGTQSQDDLEAWMKLLACASYDYMKLMVVELQHQLAEIEESERQAAASNLASSPGGTLAPRAPPRNRHNPFNDPTAKSAAEKKSRTWAEVHEQLGRKILTDRTFWAQARKVTANIQMDEDTLLVEF